MVVRVGRAGLTNEACRAAVGAVGLPLEVVPRASRAGELVQAAGSRRAIVARGAVSCRRARAGRAREARPAHVRAKVGRANRAVESRRAGHCARRVRASRAPEAALARPGTLRRGLPRHVPEAARGAGLRCGSTGRAPKARGAVGSAARDRAGGAQKARIACTRAGGVVPALLAAPPPGRTELPSRGRAGAVAEAARRARSERIGGDRARRAILARAHYARARALGCAKPRHCAEKALAAGQRGRGAGWTVASYWTNLGLTRGTTRRTEKPCRASARTIGRRQARDAAPQPRGANNGLRSRGWAVAAGGAYLLPRARRARRAEIAGLARPGARLVAFSTTVPVSPRGTGEREQLHPAVTAGRAIKSRQSAHPQHNRQHEHGHKRGRAQAAPVMRRPLPC
jgi:hypothetical protein